MSTGFRWFALCERLAGLAAALALVISLTPTCRAADGRETEHEDQQREGGYAEPWSVAQGDSIRFHISNWYHHFDITINRYEGDEKVPVTFLSNVDGGAQGVRDSGFFFGYGWKTTAALSVPKTWPSGVYDAEFRGSDRDYSIVFVVRQRTPGERSGTVVSIPFSTWQAYNNEGAHSLYPFNSSHGATYRVSFKRPYADSAAIEEDQSYDRWGRKLTAWLDHEGIPVEYIANTDIDRISALLDAYTTLVLVGHDEYWTLAERRAVERFVAAGHHLIILGGNTCWWQARLADEGNALVCYKNYALDPAFPSDVEEVTDLWYKWPLLHPENTLTGGSWRNGGLVNHDTFLLAVDGYGGYAAWQTHHWIFDGTGLEDGQIFGKADAIVGYEVDGAKFDWRDGVPVPSGVDSTPRAFRILGISPATIEGLAFGRNHATMGFMQLPSGGTVFNAATLNWVAGLEHDTIVQRITRNVFTKGAGDRLPPDIVGWSPMRLSADTVNHEAVRVSSRRISVLPNRSTRFSVRVGDADPVPLRYAWFVNGVAAGADTALDYLFPDGPRHAHTAVTVRVANARDTTSLTWDVYTKALRIVSHPKSGVQLPHTSYRYRLDVASVYADTLRFTLLRAPAWLALGDDGVLRGTVPDSAQDAIVSVAVEDRHGDRDTQSFSVNVSALGVPPVPVDPALPTVHNYPNPCRGGTTIAFTLPASGFVTLRIYNPVGRCIRTLLHRARCAAGAYDVPWDGADETGAPVLTGPYVVETSFRAHRDARPQLVRGTIMLVR